jgi:peptidoglycan/xylan/chitin deacetylase (PgdA/CDA1 family)
LIWKKYPGKASQYLRGARLASPSIRPIPRRSVSGFEETLKRRLVLNFHGIGAPHPWVGPDERPYWCEESVFCSILDDVPGVCRDRRLPIEITFDDGNASDVEVALRALRERGLAATFFVCAGRLGEPGYLDADQLRELADAGMSVGSHGWDHVDWRRVPDGATLDREVIGARDRIGQVLGRSVHAVAIPFGSYDRRVWRKARRAFSIVCTSDGGLAPASGCVVPRETYTTAWRPDTIDILAARPSLVRRARKAIGRAYKRSRPPAHC